MKKILIVDDIPEIRGLYKSALLQSPQSQFEFIFYEAHHGQHGIELIREFFPSIIVVEDGMTLMSGLEFLKKLQMIEFPPNHSKFVIFTACEMHSNLRRKAMLLGANICFDKVTCARKLPQIVASRF